MKFRVEQGEVLVKEAAEHNLVSDIKQDIPKFDTVLLHSNWSNLLKQNTLKQNPNRHKRVE